MIIQNAMRITDPPHKPFFLKSEDRHDFKAYKFADGSMIFIDGGKEYYRRGGNIGPSKSKNIKVEDFCLDDFDSFQKIRVRLLWGTRGKKGNKPLTYVLLKDCSTAHLKSILKNVLNINPLHKKVVESFLASRKKASAKTKAIIRACLNREDIC